MLSALAKLILLRKFAFGQETLQWKHDLSRKAAEEYTLSPCIAFPVNEIPPIKVRIVTVCPAKN